MKDELTHGSLFSGIGGFIETSEIIETLQNLDNNEVIRDLHNRIKKLEEQSG